MKQFAVLPLLNETLCTGCGDCVWVCPVQCLEMGDSLPWLPRPGDCVTCDLCARVCPVQAIRLGPSDTS
jgi:NAD-dependent dihydropyrimidine dehydrogenase PreA subunit